MIGQIGFGMPAALAALLVVPLLIAAAWYEARRRAAADARAGGSPALRLGTAPGRRRAQGAMPIAAAALLIVAVARPQWGFEQARVEQRGIDVAIVLDVSRSMTATDVAPSRARAAAQGLREMLDHLAGNRVALVTFAGSAFIRSPLTVDMTALANLVDRSQGDAPLVQAGTDLRVAIESATQLLSVRDRAGTQVIVLVSDGEDLGTGVQSVIDQASAQRIAIYTVFAGTETPTPLPAASGGTDTTRGDPRTLAAIARATGGSTRDVRGMAGLAVDFARMRQTQFETAETQRPRERFAWFTGAALLLLLVQAAIPTSAETPLLPRPRLSLRLPSRRGAAGIALPLLTLLLTACAGGTAAYRHVEAGNRLYGAGQFDRALEEYRSATQLTPGDLVIQYNLANALYRLGRYEDAQAIVDATLTKNPEASLAERLLYTGGSAAIQREDLKRAEAAFQQVLRQDPADRDAKANLELVLRRSTLTPPPPHPPAEQPGQGRGQEGPQAGQPGEGTARAAQQPGDAGTPSRTDPTDGFAALAAANAELEAALAALGPEVSPQEAARILELAQRANDLSGLTPRGPRGGVPAR